MQPGDRVRITQGGGQVTLAARLDASLAEGCVRVAAGTAETAGLGAMTGRLTVERLAASAENLLAKESGVAA